MLAGQLPALLVEGVVGLGDRGVVGEVVGGCGWRGKRGVQRLGQCREADGPVLAVHAAAAEQARHEGEELVTFPGRFLAFESRGLSGVDPLPHVGDDGVRLDVGAVDHPVLQTTVEVGQPCDGDATSSMRDGLHLTPRQPSIAQPGQGDREMGEHVGDAEEGPGLGTRDATDVFEPDLQRHAAEPLGQAVVGTDRDQQPGHASHRTVAVVEHPREIREVRPEDVSVVAGRRPDRCRRMTTRDLREGRGVGGAGVQLHDMTVTTPVSSPAGQSRGIWGNLGRTCWRAALAHGGRPAEAGPTCTAPLSHLDLACEPQP